MILHEDHSSAVVCLNITYHVGSKNESIERRGFAHLFEHLLFDGSKHVARGEFDKYITHAGGRDNAYTTEDKTNYYEVLPSNQLDLALWLESDRMLEFAVTDVGLATQKEVVKEEKRERYDNSPYGTVSIRMNRLAYKQFPYWWSVIGDMDTIDAATLADVRNFFEMYYQPSNSVLVLAGDFDPADAIERIRTYFEGIPNGVEIDRPAFDEPAFDAERREIVNTEPIPLPAVFYGYRIPEENSREFFALDLLCGILSAGESSRLYTSLVYDLQIASEAVAYVDAREMPGRLYLYVLAADPEQGTNELESAVNDILQNIIEQGVEPAELEKAKNKSESIIVASRLSVEGKADQLAHAALMYGDAGRVNTLLDEYLSISLEEVRSVAQKYLRTDNRVTLLYHLNSSTTSFTV